MLKSHRPVRHRRRQPAPTVPLGLVTVPAVTSALALPSLARVPVAFAAGNAAGSDHLKACAIALADAGILRPEHMKQLYRHLRPSKPNQTLAATFKFESEPAAKHLIEIALEDVTRRNRPNPLVKLGVMVASDTSLFNQDGYDSLGNNDDDARDKGGLLVSCDCQNPLHLEIGPNIQRLEQRHPGLGQTVLYWLSNGLNATVRACDPCTALEWCSNNYWMGDQDESERVEQEIDEPYYEAQQKLLPEAQRKPFDRVAEIKALDIYTRAEFDQEFPRNICSGQPKLSSRQLLRLRSRTRQPLIRIIDATLDVMSQRVEGHQPDTKNDLGLLAYASWFVCPYLLRWHRPDGEIKNDQGQDSMGMFWDDYLNQEYQAGETNLTANSAFLWHQGSPTEIAHAFHRFAAWCRTLQASENLLTSIQPRTITM